MTDDRGQHYRLLHPLGAGGMGEVYLAEDPRLGRRLALKFLPTEFAQDTSRRTRFLTEARAAAALNHPNICTVYDAGETAEGRLFIALELLEGDTLEVRLKRGPLEVGEVVRIGVQLASALETAHAKGILHRDLKPSNLHLDARGHLKVLDFGLAKRLSPEPGSAEASTQGQTQAGGILGTPQYMSPEQALGKTLDPRSDLFSCGAVLYELLTGRSPFMGPTFAELIEQIVHRPPEAIARFNYAVPPELERVVLKCLHKYPDQRYQSARELAVDLRGVEAQIRGEPVSEHPSPAQVVTWVLLGINAEELERTVGVQETTRILKNFQEAMSRGLRKFSQARQQAGLGSTVLLSFARPSNAVQWALEMVAGMPGPLQCRAGLHLGEVAAVTPEAGERYGGHLNVCERLLQLARPGQVLMGRAVFDSARQVLPTGSVEGVSQLCWVSHGPYLLEGFDGPMEVCEVGAIGRSPLSAPNTSDKARRQVRPDEESVLGWRPAVGQTVPHTPWVLEEKLGEGGFGEVWLAQHPKLRERRVFKFCFRVDRVRALKRELTLFRLLKEKVGEHPNVVRLHEVYLDASPFYLEEEFVEGKDLKTWCVAQGGIDQVPLETRLEIVAQAAEALQAAHDAGIIHRDVKPGNILVRDHGSAPTVKLTDFGIGQVISAEYLMGLTQAGFTQTMLGSTSSGTGTTMYLAPEIIAGDPATTRSDIYALGIVLFQLVIGDFRHPLTADWSRKIPDSLLREDLDHCLAGDSAARFLGAGQLAKSLRSLAARRETLMKRQEELAARERAAYRKGVVRSAAIATAVIMGVVGLAVLAATQARKAQSALTFAESRELAARRIAYASDMNLVQRSLRERNVGRASWLLDRNRPRSGETDLRHWEWRYYWEHCRSDALFTFCWHSNSVTALEFVNQGKLLAVADIDGIVRLWDVAKRHAVATLQDEGSAWCITSSADGKRLAVGGADANGSGVVRIWEMPSQRLLAELPHERRVRALAFSADASRLVAYAYGGTVALWDLVTQKASLLATFPDSGGILHEGAILFSPNDPLLMVGGRGGEMRFFDPSDAKETARVKMHSDSITALALSPDGAIIASAGAYSETAIRLWDTNTRKELGHLSGHEAWVSSLCFSEDGKTLVSGGADQTIRFWDLATRREIAVYQGHHAAILALSYAPDRRTLWSGGKDGSVLVWGVEPSSKPMALVTLPARSPQFLAFSPDSDFAATLNSDGEVVWRKTSTLEELAKFVPLGSNNCAVAMSRSGRLLAAGDELGQVRVWDIAAGTVIANLTNHTDEVRHLRFTSGDRELLGVDSQQIRLWGVGDWRTLVTWPLTNDFMDVAVSPDDQRLAFAQHDRSVTVRSVATGQLQWILRGHQDRVRGVAFTPDGQFLLSGSEDATAKLWDLATGEGRDLTRSHFLAVHSVAFSPDAGRLLTGSGGREAVKLWDTATLQEVCTLEGEGTLFRGLQCSPDGNLIAAISCEGLAHIWRAPSWAVIEAAERVQVDTTISDMTRQITGDTEERLGAADLPREPGGAVGHTTSGR